MTTKQLRDAANTRPYGCVCVRESLAIGKQDTPCSAHNPFKPCPHLHKSVSYPEGLEAGITVVTCLGCGVTLHDGRTS